MVGGGVRRGEGSLVINSTNVFAALDTRKKTKTKKSGKDKVSSSSKSGAGEEPENPGFWAPMPLKATSWADIDDEDDDDYYATAAPPVLVVAEDEEQSASNAEDSESDLDILNEVDEYMEEEHENEQEVQVQPEPEPEVKKALEVSGPTKEAEKQLSKKERKKKELAEFNALLAKYAVAPKEFNVNGESNGITKEMNDGDAYRGKNENVPAESKNGKKKKKKDKDRGSKEAKQLQEQCNNKPDEIQKTEHVEEASVVDIKEKLKKLASVKKKKPTKEVDAAAKAAAIEAAARKARLAAAKKKEKNHYNKRRIIIISSHCDKNPFV